jgi:hypothetical protein
MEAFEVYCEAMNQAAAALSKRCDGVLSEFPDPPLDVVTAEARSQLAAAMHALEVLLDQHFRIEPSDSAAELRDRAGQ